MQRYFVCPGCRGSSGLPREHVEWWHCAALFGAVIHTAVFLGIWAAARAAKVVRMAAVCNFDDAAVYVVLFGASGLPSWQLDVMECCSMQFYRC